MKVLMVLSTRIILIHKIIGPKKDKFFFDTGSNNTSPDEHLPSKQQELHVSSISDQLLQNLVWQLP